jgi:putative tryptophan/tyrosine transport system substrate-binding protein
MSYGPNIVDAYRQVGIYNRSYPQERQARGLAGRAIEQVQAGHHAQTARMFGLTVPPSLLAIADEVIE